MKTHAMQSMVEEFQCPGCVCGMNIKCGSFDYGQYRCMAHVLGTMLGLGNTVALGLPKGFNKPGVRIDADPVRACNQMDIRLWAKDTIPSNWWDHCNVAVWAMVKDGFLFVRTFSPRMNRGFVEVIEGGMLDMVPNAHDVSQFIATID